MISKTGLVAAILHQNVIERGKFDSYFLTPKINCQNYAFSEALDLPNCSNERTIAEILIF